VKNEQVHFVWTRFSELNSYFRKQAEDVEKLNGRLAEMMSLLTCNKKSSNRKGTKCSVTPELKEILTRMDARIRNLYNALPANAMLIICTGHGDTAIVHRYVHWTCFIQLLLCHVSFCTFQTYITS
jgi:RNA exonuclease 1